jgi:hypothetical protein
MFYNHNLKTSLQDWKDRLYRGTYKDFGNHLKYFFIFLENEKVLKGLIDEACIRYPLTEGQLKDFGDKIERGFSFPHDNQENHAAFNYLILKYLINRHQFYRIQHLPAFLDNDFGVTKAKLIEGQISPILYFLQDQLEKSSSTLYLLEKYKNRTEWFKKHELNSYYRNASKNYEQLFEDDLRLFLFDQGIDYPFSTPKFSSGRADVVGAIDTSDPIIVEIKIFDRSKGYGKNRIKEGFAQIVIYTNDYNKDFGYLVVFNMDHAKINFNFQESNKRFPPMITLNNRTFFFIVINLYDMDFASKVGQIESIEIAESDIIG